MFRPSSCIFLALLVIAVQSEHTNKHEELLARSYEYYPGVGYYQFSSAPSNWPTAQHACVQSGGQLVVINSEEERKIVEDMIAKHAPTNYNYVFGGFRNLIDYYYYTTTEGLLVNQTGYSDWVSGMPSGTKDMCGTISKNGALLSEASCLVAQYYICEHKLWSDYEFYPGMGYYKLHTEGNMWLEAKAVCEREGAHLLVINSQDEADVATEIYDKYPQLPGSDNNDLAFVGFRVVSDTQQTNQTARTYLTVFGTSLFSLDYHTWDKNEPAPGLTNFCGTMNRKTATYKMNACTQRLAFFCEKEIVDS